jgi:hypothetical protein
VGEVTTLGVDQLVALPDGPVQQLDGDGRRARAAEVHRTGDGRRCASSAEVSADTPVIAPSAPA